MFVLFYRLFLTLKLHNVGFASSSPISEVDTVCKPLELYDIYICKTAEISERGQKLYTNSVSGLYPQATLDVATTIRRNLNLVKKTSSVFNSIYEGRTVSS